MRLVREIRPTFVFLENVPAIRTRGLDTILKEFTKAGYDCRWTMLRASDVGAKHKRERWFLLAHANNNGSFTNQDRGSVGKCIVQRETTQKQEEGIRSLERTGCLSSYVAYAKSERLEKARFPVGWAKKLTILDDKIEYGTWGKEPENKLELDGMANGIPYRMDRIRALGNSVVPAQVQMAFKRLMGIIT